MRGQARWTVPRALLCHHELCGHLTGQSVAVACVVVRPISPEPTLARTVWQPAVNSLPATQAAKKIFCSPGRSHL